MDTPNKQESWVSRNDWAKTLLPCIMLILAPLLVPTLLNGSGLVIPGWSKILTNVAGCAGLAFTALKARLTDTISAKVFCYAILAFGYVIAIWEILDILKR